MTDSQEIEGEVPPPARRGRRGRLALGALVAAVLLVAGGGAAWWLLGSRTAPVESAEVAPDPAEEIAPAPIPEDAPLTVLELDEIVVDVAGRSTSGRPIRRFLKADYALVHPAVPEAETRVAERRVHLRDAFVDYTRLLGEVDLIGSAGLARIRADLLLRARAILGPDIPREILISDLVIQ